MVPVYYAVYISLPVLECSMHFTACSCMRSTFLFSFLIFEKPITFEIELLAHRNESNVFARRSQNFVDRILD